MADPNTRQGKRTPVTLKIKFKSETLEQFIERYAVDVSQGGIFIRTKEPLAVGTQMRFEFQLRDASPLIAGEGTVVWTRENDPSRPAIAPGMGVRFDRLAEGSQTVLERILAEKSKQGPGRPVAETTKPPMFTDVPTRVAPMPTQEALLGTESGAHRRRDDAFGDQGTPLPRPMPFHSDAEDFDEKAFEEATKVRSLDELIAQTAGASAGLDAAAPPAPAEPARAAEPAAPAEPAPVEDEAAPILPSPPEPARPPRLLDTTPSPRAEEPPRATEPAPAEPAEPAPVVEAPAPAAASPAASVAAPEAETPAASAAATAEPAKKTVLGVEAPALRSAPSPSQPPPDTRAAKDAPGKPSAARSVAAELAEPVPPAKSSSLAPMAILLFLLVAAGGAAVWFFFLREQAQQSVAASQDTGPAALDAQGPGAGSGSADPAPAATGSDSVEPALAGSASAVETPAAELVATVITASVKGATIEVVGTDQQGPAPFEAKLEKGKAYTARVQAPGFASLEIEVTGGEKPATAKLVAKPRVIAVTSEPEGAAIYVDGANTGKKTPFTVELSAAQAAKRSVRVGLRKSGFKAVNVVIDASKYSEDAAQLIAKIDEALEAQAPRATPPPTPTDTPDDASSSKPEPGSSEAPPADSGSGSDSAAQPPAPTEKPSQGLATPDWTQPEAPKTPEAPKAKAPEAQGGTAEPEPDFMKNP